MLTIDSVITFSFGGIVGFIVSELIKDRLARIRGLEAIRIVEFNKAAADFRATFVDYIHNIQHAPKTDDFGIGFQGMRQIHTDIVEREHEKAKIRFEPFIDKGNLAGFKDAWEKYRQWPEHFYDEDKPKERTITRNDMVLKHVYELLEYAKPII